MATTTNDLCRALSISLRTDGKMSLRYARHLREAGLLPVGKGGRGGVNAAHVEQRHGAALLLGMLASESAAAAPEALRLYGKMRLVDIRVRHIGPSEENSYSCLAEVINTEGGLPDWLCVPFIDLLAGFLRPIPVGFATDAKPIRIMVGRNQPIAIIEFNAHSSYLGGILFGELVYAAPADGNVEACLESGNWPPPGVSTTPVGLETWAEVPGSILADLADVLNEAEERAYLGTHGAELRRIPE